MWCGVDLNVGVGDMGQKAKPEGCECGKRLSLKAVKAPIQKNILQVSFHCLRALLAIRYAGWKESGWWWRHSVAVLAPTRKTCINVFYLRRLKKQSVRIDAAGMLQDCCRNAANDKKNEKFIEIM